MNVKSAAEGIVNAREPGKLLFIERVPQSIYNVLVDKIEESIKDEGPFLNIDFLELVKKTTLPHGCKGRLRNFDLQKPTQFRNLIATNCFLYSEDNSYLPEQIWRAYATVTAAGTEVWMNHDGRLDGIFIASPEHLLGFGSAFFKRFDPGKQEPIESKVKIGEELMQKYGDLDIKFVYFRQERLYTSSLSSYNVDFQRDGLRKGSDIKFFETEIQ